jgi:hypothetical protein
MKTNKREKANIFDLHFPRSMGGEERGPVDPGAEHFRGNPLGSLARECAQNSIDARDPSKGEPVLLRFSIEEVAATDVPTLKTELAEAWRSATERWAGGSGSAAQVFKDAEHALGLDRVQVLVISDYNTKGLTGINPVGAKSSGSWNSLVRSSGVPNSDKGAGGSFGIGKNAPFICSALRTVFYQTQSSDGRGFQGVVRLMTHRQGRQDVQPVGMIGKTVKDKKLKHDISNAVMQPDQVPQAFRRHRSDTEYGTDIFVIAARVSEDWKNRVSAALITNFFPAILDRYVVFDVASSRIDDSTLGKRLQELRHFARESGDEQLSDSLEHAYWYIKARDNCFDVTKGRLKDGLPRLGSVRLGIVQAGKEEMRMFGDMPNKCFMCRSNRMMIQAKQFNLPFPFAAFLICDDEKGNSNLRKLEPPTHNAWEQERDEAGHPIYKDLKAVMAWVRDEVAALTPAVSEEALALEAVARAFLSLGTKKITGPERETRHPEAAPKKGKKRSPFQLRPVKQGPEELLVGNSKNEGSGGDGKSQARSKQGAIPSRSRVSFLGDGRYTVDVRPEGKARLRKGDALSISAITFDDNVESVPFEVLKVSAAGGGVCDYSLERQAGLGTRVIMQQDATDGVCVELRTSLGLLKLSADVTRGTIQTEESACRVSDNQKAR